MNPKKSLLALLLLLAAAFSLFADDAVYVIREIEFEIDGRTRPYALVYHGEFKYGERINGQESFYRYLALRRQLLINQHVLEEVRIEYFLGEREEDGALPVRLLVYVRDTWNFFILPHPEYNSNDGFSITLKARHYNFLGTMSALRVDFGYSQNDGNHQINASVESRIPFYAAGLNWALRFDNFLGYTFGEPLFYQNVTGLSVELPWRSGNAASFLQNSVFTVGFNQYLTVNEENSDEAREIHSLGERFSGTYGSTEIFANWRIPLGLEVGGFGQLSYIPQVSGRINYPYGIMDESRRPVTTLRHSLGFGRVNWIGNYRKGLSASIGNSFAWYIDREDAPLKIGLDGNAVLFWPFTNFLGVSARLNYRQWWHRSDRLDGHIPHFGSGDMIRGVLNDDIRAHQIFTFNLDIPVRVLRFWPSEWFNNERLRFFNFEMHFAPFTDLALFQGPYNRLKNRENPSETETNFSLNDMINTTGLEVHVYPGSFRSVQIRASIGYNIRRIRSEGLDRMWGFFPAWDEIFVGLNFHY